MDVMEMFSRGPRPGPMWACWEWNPRSRVRAKT